MRRFRPYIVGAVGGVLALVLLVLSGLFDFGASRGFSPLDWLQQIGVRQSVALRSAMIEVPEGLDNPAMIRRGAGHYEMVCAQCHGSPDQAATTVAADMVPMPPPLVERMDNWRPDARVFWTVQHGIRGSAMPAWPTQMRDDEVWAMVALLDVLPELTPEAYRALVGTRETPLCETCHGPDGRGYEGAFPRLDIQSPDYLEAALRAFRNRTRASGTMMAAASGLSDAEIADLASRFGAARTEGPAGDPLGAQIATRGIPERDVPACDSCHGPAGRADYPRLAGQTEAYILVQLKLFAEHGAARGGPYAGIMAEVVKGLSEDDMQAVAAHYGQ